MTLTPTQVALFIQCAPYLAAAALFVVTALLMLAYRAHLIDTRRAAFLARLAQSAGLINEAEVTTAAGLLFPGVPKSVIALEVKAIFAGASFGAQVAAAEAKSATATATGATPKA